MKQLSAKITLIWVFVLVSLEITAQVPQWKSGYFKELDNSYIETASGVGKTIDEARDKAASEIIRKRDMATGASARVVNGQVTTSGELMVKSRVLDEYTEQLSTGEYRVYLLTQTAKHPSNSYEPVSVSDEYPFSARCFVPGMQQLYKGQRAKGIAFIAAEAACIGGIVLSQALKASYTSKMNSTHNSQQKQDYSNRANAWNAAGYGFIAGAVVFYAWNIIDGIVSPGRPTIKYNDNILTFVPAASPDFMGMSLTLTF